MFGAGISHADLCACLAATAPVDLLGMRLLQAHPQATLFPTDIPRDVLKNAVAEIVAYTGRCAAAMRRVSDLSSVPLTTIQVWGFGL